MIAAALALLLALGPSADSLQAPCPGGQVLTREDLRVAGVTHLHDVLWLVDGLDAVTVDGFDAEPVVSFGLPFRQPVRILMDGAPVASGTTIEPAGMEFLPVALGEVERIVVCPGPGVAGGAWGGPWLDIQTAPPARRAYGAIGYGNETGDPGPARYLDPTLPNVDHWGPDFEAALVARRGPRAAWAALRDRGFFPTDTSIAPRIFEAVRDLYPTRSGTSVALATASPTLRVRVGGFRGIDLPYIPEVRREVPVSRRTVQAAVSGTRGLGARQSVTGHLYAARLLLRRPAWNALPIDPHWTETRLNAALTVERTLPGGALAAGIQGEGVDARGPGLADGTAGIGRLWVQVERHRGPAALALTLQGSLSESGAAAGGALVGRRRLRPGLEASFTLAADRTLPEAIPDLALWARRGYAGLGGLAPALASGSAPRPFDHALARFDVASSLGAGVQMSASATVHAARGEVLLTEPVRPGEPTDGAVHLAAAEGGAVSAIAAATWNRGRLRLRVRSRVQRHIGGNDPYREVSHRLPRLQAAAEATVRPDARLSLWGRLTARTGTTWSGYPNADVPGALLLDLGLGKRAWGDRLWLSVSGRNVLDAAERTHPLGATLAPRLFVRVDVRL